MKTLKIIQKLCKIQNLTFAEQRQTGAALNASGGVIGCITDYLSYEMGRIDAKLANPAKLYDRAGADRYVTFKLAERAKLNELLNLLTESVEVLDDDQSEVYNEQ